MITKVNDFIEKDEYIASSLAHTYLNITPSSFKSIKKVYQNELNIISYKNKHYILKKDIENLYEKQKKFWKEHIPSKVAKKQYSDSILKQLKTIKIPIYAKIDINETVFVKSEIQNIIENRKKQLIPKSDCLKILNIIDYNFKMFVKEYKLEYEIIGQTRYYYKEDIEFFKEQQKDFGTRYISYKNAEKKYSISVYTAIKGYPIPYFARRKDTFFKSEHTYYDVKEIEDYLKKRNMRETIYNTKGNTHFDTFLLRLSLKPNYNSFKNKPYTKEKWFNYVDFKLKKTTASEKNKNKYVNFYVNLTLILEDFLEKNNNIEVYMLSTSLINLFLQTCTTERNKVAFYNFFKLVYQDIQLKINISNNANKGFNFSKIKNPYTKDSVHIEEKNLDIEIYSYSDYAKIFKFLTDIPFHVDKSIKNIDKINLPSYLSTWLYLLLHLNNAWRHGDVTNFPRIFINDILEYLKIDSFNWFLNNSIDLNVSKKIISRVIKYEFKVNKTKVDAHFFCSDSLAPALATNLLMLEFFIKTKYIGIEKEYNEPIMIFNTKYNEPSIEMINHLFKPINIPNFKFSSKKMNKSIMSYIYTVANSQTAIMLPKHLRSHKETNSTLHYLKLNKEDIEFLTEQLFQRGEFGYILDSLVEIITNKPKSLETRTNDIKLIKDFFGDNIKIEATIGLMNYFQNEKSEILNILYSKGYEECVSILNNIYKHNLPSRQENVQCLMSKEGCKYPELNSCLDCRYNIPSVYALSTLCNSLKEDIDNYFSTTNKSKKIKLSMRLYRKKDILRQALLKYDQEYIYNCLNMTREEFLSSFSSIKKPKELL